jgi:hypothetical protein
MRRQTIGILLMAAIATALTAWACDPTVENGIFGIGGSGEGGGGGGAGGAATHLVFTSQPSSTPATQAMATNVIVQAEDGVGAVDTSFNDVITLSLSTNPDGASLTGNFSVSAINGIATLNNLAVDKADTGYVLMATSGALTAAFSVKFTITP